MGSKQVVLSGLILAIVATLCIVLPVVLITPDDEQQQVFATATVNDGDVVGVMSKESAMFLGIPFSKPPVGELRWRRPVDPEPYPDRYWNATYLRPACSQICDQPIEEYSCPHEESEDCLYLNVWVPRNRVKKVNGNELVPESHYTVEPDQKMAVMVWFYGGNFRNGAGSCTVYDGRFMADQGDVIVVTTNYRVAQLGFLAFGTDGGEESLGNFGLYDQIKTLEWVKNNINSFGGDSDKVTIFGQSAGAESGAVHMTSELSDKYFHQAIFESNPFGLPFRTLDDSRELGQLFAANLSCTNLECMRTKTLSELEAAYNSTLLAVTDPSLLMLLFQPWGPIIDGELLTDQPINLFRKGLQQSKPIIMGSMADEGMIFLAEAFPDPMDKPLYTALVTAVFKSDADAVKDQYPSCSMDNDPSCDNRVVLTPAVTDYVFFCPQRLALFNGTTYDQWLFYFNQTWSFRELWEIPECFDRVCHAADLAYVFGIESLTEFEYTDEERQLSKRMIEYWTNFAKYSNPNGEDGTSELMEWPRFNSGATDYTALQMKGSGDELMLNPFEESCAFWDDLDAYTKH